jgi:hypothetical protein
VSWLDTIRKTGALKARPIRILSDEEKRLVNENGLDEWKRRESDLLDAELRRMWIMCAVLFTTLVAVSYELLTHIEAKP